MQEPLVSVIVPCFNHEKFVEQCIRSIVDQDYRNIELIVIDDGSKDGSVEKINELVPVCRARFARFEFRHRANKGLCATLNEALEWCKGEYVSPFASDDIALPHKTSYLVSKIMGTDFAAVFGGVSVHGPNAYRRKKNERIIIHNFDELICGLNIPPAPAALIRTSEILRAGLYKELLPIEDWYMWLKLTENGKTIASFPDVVALYRRHEGNMTNNLEKMQESRLLVLKEFKGSGLYRSAVRYSYLQSARDYSRTNKFAAFRKFLLSLPPRRNTLFVAAKIIAPSRLIELVSRGGR